MITSKRPFRIVVLSVALLWPAGVLQAQPAPVEKSARPAAPKTAPRTPKKAPNAQRPGGTPEQAKPNAKKPDSKPAASGEASKTEAEPKVTRRPTQPAAPPDPKELELRPNAEGKVYFNFNGQPWPAVMEWLAEISGLSLDWQELPGDYLNLVTQREYTVPEARDLINRYLLARGYTMIRSGEILSVHNIKKLNPAMIPRVEPEELATRDPHEFVKVSFALDSLLAEKAVEEFKPMMSSNGTLAKLEATNRLEAVDAVINLREIYRLLQEEQAGGSEVGPVRVFQLNYVRAEDVVGLLKELLGIKDESSQPMTPQQMQAMQQARMRAQQQGKPAPAGPKKPDVHLVVNPRENCILAHAPPDKMALIAEAVKAIDVPPDRADNLLQNMSRMQIYRLAAIDPEPLVETLRELGNLDPTTELQIDKKNNAVIAYASLADHVTIRALIEKLDGSGREFHVIPLRRLEADYVAGTVDFMMGGREQEKPQQPSRSYFIYDPFSRRGSNQDEGGSDEFRVDADVEHNRLLLWANDVEVREVENLLIKLGEIPPKGGNQSTYRFVEAPPGEDAEQLLERIRREWNLLQQPNRLLIAPPPKEETPDEEIVPVEPPKVVVPPSLLDTSAQREVDGRRAPAFVTEPQPIVAAAARHASSPSVEPPRTLRGSHADADRPPEKARLVIRQPSERLLSLLQAGQEQGEFVAWSKDGNVADAPAAESKSPQSPSPPQAGENRQAAAPPDATEAVAHGIPSIAGGDQQVPPVSITFAPDGSLILSSQDTAALDLLEDILFRHSAPRQDYKIFKMKYSTTWAYGVALNLEEFFDVEEEEQAGYSWNPFYGRTYSQGSSDDDVRRLSKRRPLKFIADSDTNTILVQGADPQQLQTIEELIDLYDQPITTDSRAVRRTQVFPIRYSKAAVIAEAVKDVYRDLLSSNDKALQNGNKNQEKPPERSYTYIYGSGGSEQDGEKDTPIKFKGLLSIGVDELSNTLVVSATEGLLINIGQMIEALDMAARPTSTVQVLQVDSRINTAVLQEQLKKMFGKPAPPPKQQQPGRQPNQPGQNNQQQQQQRGGDAAVSVGGG